MSLCVSMDYRLIYFIIIVKRFLPVNDYFNFTKLFVKIIHSFLSKLSILYTKRRAMVW